MGYYQNLSPSVQNVVMLNFQTIAKYMILGAAFIFSVYYIFFYWKEKKETTYILVGLVRIDLA